MAMASKKTNHNPHSGDGASPGKIFIGGLAKDTTLDTFIEYFGKYGEIIDSVIMKDRQTGRPRGFGFITYADPTVVDRVIEETHIINDKQVEIKRTIPKGAGHGNDFKTKKIFVGGIPTAVTEDEFKSFFSEFGKVVDHEIIHDHVTKRSRGFGFVVFDSEKVVDNVLANGNRIELAGTQVELKKAEPKKASNPAHVPAFGSASRAHPYNDSFGGFGDSLGGFGPGGYGASGYGPASYRSLGAYGSRFGDYGGYPDGHDFGSGFGGFGGGGGGGGAFSGYRGEPPFGYSSRFGSSYGGGPGGGYGGSGIGAYGREARGYGGYEGSGPVDGYDSGPGASYGGPRGMYGSGREGYGGGREGFGGGREGYAGGREGYAGTSRYHPYGR